MAAADSVISSVSSSISLALSTSLASDCRYSSSIPQTSLIPSRIFSLVDEIAFSEFSTNFRRASALFATVLSELTTNVLASPVTA